MSNTQIIPLSNLPALRGNSDHADQVEQLRQYAAAQTGLIELAAVIEAEARAAGTLADRKAVWDIADGAFRVVCTLNTETRKMVIVVHTQGFSETVLRDDDLGQFVFNCPAGARWPVFLKEQHELAQARRGVAAAQAERERLAAQSKRQAAI